MEKKMTYVQALEIAISNLPAELDDVISERLNALKEALVKRNANKSDKPTKTQQTNVTLKAEILEMMECGERHTVTEWKEMLNKEEITSTQKMSALLKQMKDVDGTVEAVTDKRKTLYFKK